MSVGFVFFGCCRSLIRHNFVVMAASPIGLPERAIAIGIAISDFVLHRLGIARYVLDGLHGVASGIRVLPVELAGFGRSHEPSCTELSSKSVPPCRAVAIGDSLGGK